MKCPIKLLSTILLGTLLLILPSTAFALDLGEKAKLQGAMASHIDQLSINGNYPYLDTKTCKRRRLHAVTAHPVIMQIGKDYVLCFDFKDEGGRDVTVDFYIAPKNDFYVVFHTAIANRALLEGLIKTGAARRAK